MKMPETITAYCPHCKKRTQHKLKPYKKGATRKTAWGQAKHEEKGKGYKSKIAGKVTVYKQAKRQEMIMTCAECGKKRPKSFGGRTKKTLELIK